MASEARQSMRTGSEAMDRHGLRPRDDGIKVFLQWSAALCFACAALLASPAAQAQGYEVQPWPARKAMPTLEASDLNGKVWRLADLRGKVVLINFWASWCEPCRAEMPALQALADFYGPEKLVVLAVNFKESNAKMAQYVRSTGLSLPVLPDPAGDIARRWGVNVFPTTVLIAADGKPRQRIRGELDWTGREAEALLKPLFKR